MNIVTKRVDELRHPDKNVRIHTTKQIDEYIRSLNMFDQIRPLVVDEDGVILIGNGMYEALVRMGRETCECEVKAGLTEVQKKKLMLADNKIFELGLTDSEAFENILRDIGTDFDIPGYDASMLEMLTMSFGDVDEYISGYGAFEQDDVERINSKTAETHVEGVATGFQRQGAAYPLSNYVPEGTAVPGPTNGQNGTPIDRYITCPHCGERFLISGEVG